VSILPNLDIFLVTLHMKTMITILCVFTSLAEAKKKNFQNLVEKDYDLTFTKSIRSQTRSAMCFGRYFLFIASHLH
jgi:hypothetical protein